MRRKGLTLCLVLMVVFVLTPRPADAVSSYKLDVTYTNGSMISGPLSFGLSTLPTSVIATFMLGPGQPTTTGNAMAFNQTDVRSANISFGDATWTVSALEDFSMLVVSGGIRSLTYNFNPINTGLFRPESRVTNVPDT